MRRGRHLTRRAAAVAAMVMAAAAGCGGGGSSKPAAHSSASSTVAAPDPAADAAADAKEGVTLVDAGAQPRAPLLLHLSAGTTTRAELVSKIGLDMTVGGVTVPVGKVPDTKTVLTQQVDRVDPDGTGHYILTFVDVSLVPAPGANAQGATEAQAALAQMKGLRGTGTVDVHGSYQTATFDTSAVTDPQIKSTLDSVSSQLGNLSAPFPRQPVGPGARWTSKRRATINGSTVDTAAAYTLRDRTGDRYHLDATQDAVAPPGPAAIPNLPAGTAAGVKSFTLHFTGGLDGTLTRQLPLSSTATGGGDGTLSVSQGAREETVVEHLTIDFSMSSS